MTFRTQEVFEGIHGDMPIKDVARLFAACCARMAADGREAMEAFKDETDKLDDSDKGEVQGWMADIFPEDEE